MSTNPGWFPKRLADQLVMFTNVLAKISTYRSVFPITNAQSDRVELICNVFIAVYNYVAQARATTESLVEWRDNIFNGDPVGDPAPTAPAYVAYVPVAGEFVGIFQEFRDLVELVKASPGYTRAIGEDLMIVAPEGETLDPDEVAPSLKVTTSPGYEVTVAGSMHGMDAMRVEYQKNGAASWSIAAFLTKTPGTFTITPATPGEPEAGRIRAVFIKKNEEFGGFSPEYPITVS